MKKLLFVLFCCVFCSCGSNWTISGNEINVTRCVTDTIVPAGTVILDISNER